MKKQYAIATLRLFICLFFFKLYCQPAFSQWSGTTDITGVRVNEFCSAGSDLFAGTDTGGIFKSADEGNNWTAVNTGLPNKKIKALVWHKNRLIAASSEGFGTGNFYVSDDKGANWRPNKVPSYGYVYCLQQNTTDLFAGTWYGILKSSDTGSTWSAMPSTGLPSNASVSAIVIRGNTFFAGVSSSSVGGTGVFLTTNNGSSWNAKNTGLTNTTVISMAASANEIYAGTQGGGIFISFDNGNNWSARNIGLTNPSIRSISIQGSDIFVGTDDGIFRSVDKGLHWTDIGQGQLTGSSVFAIGYTSTQILAGTESSVFKRPLSQVSDVQSEVKNENLHIYPNPATNGFHISSNSDIQKILMLSMDGKAVFSLTPDGNKNELFIQPEGISHGMYFLLIETEKGNNYTRKIVIN